MPKILEPKQISTHFNAFGPQSIFVGYSLCDEITLHSSLSFLLYCSYFLTILNIKIFRTHLQDRDRKLRIFVGGEHPFGDKPLEPYVMPPRQVREMRPRARRAMVRAQKKAVQQEGGQNVSKGKNREEKAVVSS